MLGLNFWTISGLLLILFGSYCIHRGARQTITTTVNNAAGKINTNTKTVIGEAKNEITDPLNKLDDFLLKVYKPNFDDLVSALNTHGMYLEAVNWVEDGKVKGIPQKSKEKIEKATKQKFNNKVNEANNVVNAARTKVNANIRNVELINHRIDDEVVKRFWKEHKEFCEEARDYYNGTSGKDKSYKKSKEAIREAEIRLISMIYIIGEMKK